MQFPRVPRRSTGTRENDRVGGRSRRDAKLNNRLAVSPEAAKGSVIPITAARDRRTRGGSATYHGSRKKARSPRDIAHWRDWRICRLRLIPVGHWKQYRYWRGSHLPFGMRFAFRWLELAPGGFCGTHAYGHWREDNEPIKDHALAI